MGDGLTMPSKADAFVIGTHLNEMFDAAHFPTTKTTITTLQGIYPELLVFNDKDGGNKKRKSALRFAGWLLTSDIDFTAGTTKPYPEKKFIKWLRWLTWIDRHKPNGTVVEQLDAANTATTLKEEPAQAIMSTITQALASGTNGVNIHFHWKASQGAEPDLQVTVKRIDPDYTISVISKQNAANSIKDNEDDELP